MPGTTNTATAATTYNRYECCWKCKQRGHTRFNCQRAPRKFCSQCGKDGVYTRDCHPRAGNSVRTGDTTGEAPVIRYTPRPHITIRIGDQKYEALLDTGSEATFVNEETAARLQELGCPRRGELKHV